MQGQVRSALMTLHWRMPGEPMWKVHSELLMPTSGSAANSQVLILRAPLPWAVCKHRYVLNSKEINGHAEDEVLLMPDTTHADFASAEAGCFWGLLFLPSTFPSAFPLFLLLPSLPIKKSSKTKILLWHGAGNKCWNPAACFFSAKCNSCSLVALFSVHPCRTCCPFPHS